MEVYFDWELDDKVDKPIHPWVYDELRTFIKSRYKPLEEEIDRRKTREIAFAGFIWHDNADIEVRYYGIPDDLIPNVHAAISQSDMDYIMEQIGQKIDNKNKLN